MRHFLRLANQVDVIPLLLDLHRQESLWNAIPLRTQTPGTPHSEVDDILLRLQPLDGSSDDRRECVNYQSLSVLPSATKLIFDLMARVNGERLGRCMLTRLHPGGQIAPHTDVGDHPMHYDTIRYYDRFHIVLQADRDSLFRAEDEVVNMLPGEAWWFNNAVEHEVMNNGKIDRIHLIVDIRTMHL